MDGGLAAEAGRAALTGPKGRPVLYFRPQRNPLVVPYHLPQKFQRSQDELRHVRTRVRQRYALLPLEGYPVSRLPAWVGAEARILATPALGASFVQYLVSVAAGGRTHQPSDGTTETFIFILDGVVHLSVGDRHELGAGGFVLIPPTIEYSIEADRQATLLILKKRYEPVPGVDGPSFIVGHEADVPAEVWLGIEGARLQSLIPEDRLEHDMAMNIFSFEPGYSLPVVETHVMEHGLYFLQGKGLYYLDEEWMEVEAGDYIWMGPFVPQSFYAAGREPARYIYYKNINRDVAL